MALNKKKITDVAMNVGIRFVAVPLGFVAGEATNKIKFVNDLNPWVKGLGKALIGAIIPEIHNKPNDKASLALASFGAGLSASGGHEIAKAVIPGIVSGIETVGNPAIMAGLVVDENYKVAGGEEEGEAENSTNKVMGVIND